MLRIVRYGNSRFWALYDGEDLVVVTVYKRGAREVQRRLAAQPLAGAEAAAQAAAVEAAARQAQALAAQARTLARQAQAVAQAARARAQRERYRAAAGLPAAGAPRRHHRTPPPTARRSRAFPRVRQGVRHSPRSRHLQQSLGAPAGKGGLRALFPQATCAALASTRARRG